MRDAVTNKFLTQPLTKDQLAAFYPFPNMGK
jgi:hypothetical protein